MIKFDSLKCLRFDFKGYDCSKCLDICQDEAFFIDKNSKLNLDIAKCIDCKACIGSCPSEAISSEFDESKFSLESKDNLLSCKINTPCLATFDTHHFLVMALRDNLKVDLSHCKKCELKYESLIKSKIESTNEILKTSQKEPIEILYQVEIKPKRELFKKLITKITPKDELTFDSTYPKKNQILNTILRDSNIDLNFSLFVDRFINKSCINCFDCFDFCPTKAIEKVENSIFFTPIKCINCSICEMICKFDSIYTDKLDSKYLFEKKLLISHDMRICKECNMPHSFKGEEICYRCREIGDEFKDIFKLAQED